MVAYHYGRNQQERERQEDKIIFMTRWLRGLSLLHETTGEIHSRNTCVSVLGSLINEIIENNIFLYFAAKCSEILWEKTT